MFMVNGGLCSFKRNSEEINWEYGLSLGSIFEWDIPLAIAGECGCLEQLVSPRVLAS